MSLTQGLLLLAVAVLAALIGHGLWTTWKARPRRAGPVESAAQVAAGERREPVFEAGSDGGTVEAGASAEATAAVRPAKASADASPVPLASGLGGAQVEAASPAHQLRLRPVPPIDALVDAICEIAVESPLSGEAAAQALPTSRRAGGKPMLIEGLNAESGRWEPVRHGQWYGAFQAAVQLANRNGALNEIEYSEFVQKAQALADALGGSPDFADMTETVARARELDDFARQHDAQLAVHIEARGSAWTVGYLTQTARRHGAVEGGVAGQLVLPSDEPDAPPLVVLSFDAQAALAEDPDASALRACTLSLDVAQSAESSEPFARWQRLASDLARDLGGELVDDDGRAVSVQQFAAIHRELLNLYAALAARDLAAGSVAARRLFS